MVEEKEYLQITLTKIELPKNKLIKWLYWKIYFKVWCIYRPKFLAWFFGGLYNLCEKFLSNERETVRKHEQKEKDCSTCKHRDLSGMQKPCLSCFDDANWEQS